MKKNFTLILATLLLLFSFVLLASAQQKSIRGNLKSTVESGGWLIVENNQKYLLLNASKFKSENWFREGTEVMATGELKPDVMTIYQEGTPFEAKTLRPMQNSSGSLNSANNGNLTTITVTGDSSVMAQPDTAILSIAVVTQNSSAIQAQQENAARTTAVINTLKASAGSDAEIKTSGYSINPQRIYKENQPPIITGYEVRNSITVTMKDLNRIGSVIDAATKSGANNIDGISFTLRNDRDARNRALTEATREAIAKANVLAQALGGRVVRITSVQESGSTPRPIPYVQRQSMAGVANTPVEVGNIEINSQVQLFAEIETGMNQR